MTAHYLYISLSTHVSDHKPIQEVLNTTKDWLRFHGSNYLVYTSMKAEDMYQRLKPLLPAEATMLIFLAQPETEHRGWMSQLVVDWLKKQHSEAQSGT